MYPPGNLHIPSQITFFPFPKVGYGLVLKNDGIYAAKTKKKQTKTVTSNQSVSAQRLVIVYWMSRLVFVPRHWQCHHLVGLRQPEWRCHSTPKWHLKKKTEILSIVGGWTNPFEKYPPCAGKPENHRLKSAGLGGDMWSFPGGYYSSQIGSSPQGSR